MRGPIVLLTILAATAAPRVLGALTVPPGGFPVTRVAGGGPRGDDCLAQLELMGVGFRASASRVTCTDGDRRCDRDGLVNGRCELWVRACLGHEGKGCAPRPVTRLSVDETDADATSLARAAALLAQPTSEGGACSPITTLTVPLGRRANGSPRAARKRLTLTASADGAADADQVTFACTPPPRDRRRDQITFALLQKRVFEKSCAFAGCHDVANPQAGLALTGDGVYEQLVDRLATASAAQFAGKKRVVPGAPETSFLMDKLEGKLAPGEGDRMPFARQPLAEAQIEAIRRWIQAGAPRERAVDGGLRGDADRQPRIAPPAVPAGGYQAHMAAFPLGDLPETEGCQFARLENPTEMDVGQWELFMHEGSHHFILRAFRCTDADGDGTDDCDEPDFDARFPTGFRPCDEFGRSWGFVVGSQTPHFLVDYQTATTGVALRLHRRQPLLLNSHYTNPYSDSLAEVWVNATPVDSALVRHPARILFEEIANAFLRVAPGTWSETSYLTCAFRTDTICQLGGEREPTAEHFALLGVSSHMHKRSHRFVTDLFALDGRRLARPDDMTDATDGSSHLYVSTEYNDPVSLAFWPPIVVAKGQELRYTCHEENGVLSPVRMGCEETPGETPGRSAAESILSGHGTFGGASRWCRTDADCAGFGTGRCVPANLVLGERADDEMCILPGLYYPCPGDAASCLE